MKIEHIEDAARLSCELEQLRRQAGAVSNAAGFRIETAESMKMVSVTCDDDLTREVREVIRKNLLLLIETQIALKEQDLRALGVDLPAREAVA